MANGKIKWPTLEIVDASKRFKMVFDPESRKWVLHDGAKAVTKRKNILSLVEAAEEYVAAAGATPAKSKKPVKGKPSDDEE